MIEDDGGFMRRETARDGAGHEEEEEEVFAEEDFGDREDHLGTFETNLV